MNAKVEFGHHNTLKFFIKLYGLFIFFSAIYFVLVNQRIYSQAITDSVNVNTPYKLKKIFFSTSASLVYLELQLSLEDFKYGTTDSVKRITSYGELEIILQFLSISIEELNTISSEFLTNPTDLSMDITDFDVHLKDLNKENINKNKKIRFS